MLRSNSWDLNSPRQGYQITKRDPQYNSDGKYFKTVDGETVRKLFVGNLPDPVNGVCVAHGLLNDIFRQYGRVVDVSVVHRPHAKPFAFVTFYTPQDAAKAYKRKDTLCILKRKLFLSFADGWHQPLELPDGSIVWDRRKQGTTALVPQEEVVDKVHDLDSEAPVPLIDESLHGPQDDDEEEEEETPDTETSAIDTLNDDCLQLIFDLLPIVDRMALSRVCSRWRSLNSYYWRSFRKLDFTSPLLDRILLTDKTLLYFLHLCPNVTSLNIAQDDNDLSSEAIVIIAKSCKNLKEIHMRNITIKYRSLAYLANCCPKLKAFSMDACTSQHDAEMISLVKKSRNLESITLKYGCGTNGYWLKHLQPPLRKLVLEMYEFDGDNLLEGIKKVNSTLRELSFVSCSELRNRDLQNIINLCPDITKFALSGILQLHEFRSILPITQLSKLENLDLEHNRVVCDKFIDALVEGCPALRQLNLSGIESFDLTERGLFQLVKLTNLTHLRMACIKVTDNLLKALAKKLKLEHLDITGCLNVTDEGCIEILKHCPELESLDLAGCLRVTNETIQAAINVLSNDPTRVKLNIVCGNSGVFDEPWFHESETTKRLNIDLKSTIIANFFEDFYRMDYDDFDPGSEDSYDHDIYDDDDDDPYDIFEGVAFADDYDAYGEIRLRLGPYLAEDYSESDDDSF